MSDTLTGDDGRKPHWYSKLDGDADGFQRILAIKTGKMRLKETRRGVDLYITTNQPKFQRVCTNFYPVLDAMRGWRSVQAERPLPRYGFQLIPTEQRDEYFACSLAPGKYVIEQCPDGSSHLLWRDTVGTANTPQPKLAPEVLQRYHYAPVPESPRPITLREQQRALRNQPAPAPAMRRRLPAPARKRLPPLA